MKTVDKIIMLLKEKGLNQIDLAEHLGIKKTIISDWKAGRTQSYLAYIKEIAKFLDTTVEYLISDTDEDDEVLKINTDNLKKIYNHPVDLSKFDTTSIELVTTFNELSLRDKTRVLNYIFELKNEVGE